MSSTSMLNVRMDPALRSKLADISEARGLPSLSAAVREAIRDYVEHRGFVDAARQEIADSIDWAALTPRAWRHLPIELAVLCPAEHRDRLRGQFERQVREEAVDLPDPSKE